jgi:hypothetical protein
MYQADFNEDFSAHLAPCHIVFVNDVNNNNFTHNLPWKKLKGSIWKLEIILTTAIGLLGFVASAHHMFTVRICVDTWAYFTSATIIVALPTGIQFFRSLVTVHGSWLTYRATCLGSLGFVFLFTIGLTGVLEAIIMLRELKQIFPLPNFLAICYDLIFLFPVMLNLLAIEPSTNIVCLK